jgi:endonuclease G
MLAATAAEPLEQAYERYIGNNDLLPINYLQIGEAKSRAVGRLRYFDLRVARNAMASGFLVSPDLVMTNHHVFSAADSFRDAFIDFDYAYGADGRELDRITFQLDPEKFFYANATLDCAVIGIKNMDEANAHQATGRGYLVLNPDQGKTGVGDSATIIQYPGGDYQQIALRRNEILEIKPDALTYVSDTAPGSSGSPVFNDQWQVIALHSAGVAKKDPTGKFYVDKNNNPIPVVNGQVDSSQIVWESNTGIRVTAIMADLLAQPAFRTNPYLQFLNRPDYSDNKARNNQTNNGQPLTHESVSNKNNPMNSININPSSSRPGITININVNLGDAAPASRLTASQQAPATAATTSETEDFEAKLADEQNADYSHCNGFDKLFMGAETPMPKLGAQLARKVATLTHNPKENVLRYEHYSTIVHSVRRMPVVSAINVEGDPVVRRDKAARQDNWMRDNRIPFDVQLNDAFYKSSGFDKGHMSRREDAKWGNTAAGAESAAQMTCMYTNACPQVPDINRAVYGYHGLWGQLEQIVLEQGAEGERGDASKMCVYNGPVFVDTDPTFKGVQVPMRFFKVVVWRNAAKEMKATAFILSQENLVGDIQFEELQFDQKFIEHQCSIPYLEKLTDLTFTGIGQYDTWTQGEGGPEVKPVTRAEVENHVTAHGKKAGGRRSGKTVPADKGRPGI